MDNYIDVLLEALCRDRASAFSREAFREHQALDALMATLSDEQRELFLAYEAAHNETASISEDAYARSAFELARKIFR